MVTITDVTVSKDLRHAHIYYTMYGSEEEMGRSATGLQKATKFIQSQLGRRIRLRYTPIIDFRIDQSFEYGSKIDKILDEIRTSAQDDEAKER
jgi:ribosome-binding factor A